MLRAFDELGKLVAAKWSAAGRRNEAFTDIATTALSNSGVLTTVEPHDIVSWLMMSQQVPEQDPYDFGQPPINVYTGDGFYIQALFWIDGTTSIHEHGFVGAFGVLLGSSVESIYSFTEERLASERVIVGRTQFLSSELLVRGNVRPIYCEDKLIHSLFHLDRPSVSVVIRTPKLKSARPQYYYSKPYLALSDDGLSKLVPIQLQLLQSLWVIDRARFWSAALEVSLSCDPYVLYQVLSLAFKVSRSDPENWNILLAAVGARDQWLMDHLLPCLQDDRRTEKLKGLRNNIHDPMHRFFLALLLNVPTREDLYKLVKQRFPQEIPSALVLRWLGEIFKEERAGIKLTPSWLFLLERIFEDAEFEHSKLRLRKLFKCANETNEEKLRKAWMHLQTLDILAPLMNTAPNVALIAS